MIRGVLRHLPFGGIVVATCVGAYAAARHPGRSTRGAGRWRPRWQG